MSRHQPPKPARAVAEIAVVSVLTGVLAGVAWWLLAPDVTVEVVDNGVALTVEQGRELFGRESDLAWISAAAGTILAAVFMARHRRLPVTTLLTLVVGGAAGSFVALGVGRLLGPDAVDAQAADAAVGAHLSMPLAIEASAVFLAWPLAATIVVAVIAVFRDDHATWQLPGEPKRTADPVSQAARSSPSSPT